MPRALVESNNAESLDVAQEAVEGLSQSDREWLRVLTEVLADYRPQPGQTAEIDA